MIMKGLINWRYLLTVVCLFSRECEAETLLMMLRLIRNMTDNFRAMLTGSESKAVKVNSRYCVT